MTFPFIAVPAYPVSFRRYQNCFAFNASREAWLECSARFPVKSVQLFCLHWLYRQVQGGGFWQFFHDSTGTFAPEASDGFAAIGMPEVAAIVDQAIARLGTDFPDDRISRQYIIGRRSDPMDFSDLDAAFMDLAGPGGAVRKLPKYVAFADAYSATPGPADLPLVARPVF